jgi:hypothetical protein
MLEEAYARGEISRNEPLRKRQDLLHKRGGYSSLFPMLI